MDDYTFFPSEDTSLGRICDGHYMCNRCGVVIDKGLMNFVNHEVEHHSVVYKTPTDNEIRIAFMELGMPDEIFKSLDLDIPSSIERRIYLDNSPFC